MKTKENIDKRGKASISIFNLIKKITKVVAIVIGAILTLILWVFIRPILRGCSWLVSVATVLAILFWLLTL